MEVRGRVKLSKLGRRQLQKRPMTLSISGRSQLLTQTVADVHHPIYAKLVGQLAINISPRHFC